ncbi:MAG: hypothetical protein OEP52_04445 [Acidimicrobiia bacterium]|nr:hypothetical protein [Acidimicrobiia bacterium]
MQTRIAGERITALGVALVLAMSVFVGPARASGTGQDARNAMIATATSLIPTGSNDADKKLTEAVKRLGETLEDKFWTSSEAFSKEGNKVFDKDRDTVKKLLEAIKKLEEAALPSGSVQTLVDDLVQEDRRMAEATIAAAVAAGASDSKIEEAYKELAKAEKELADGKPQDAIDKFKRAWETAFKAEAEAVKDSADGGATGGGDYSVYTFWFIEHAVPGAVPFSVTGTNESGTYGYTGRNTEGYLQVRDEFMQLHVSCSDAFTGGTGDKSDPQESSKFRVVNYMISKYKDGTLDKTCNLTGVPDYGSVSLAADYSVDGVTWQTGDDDPPLTHPWVEEVRYRFTVTNSGSLVLSDITLTDELFATAACAFSGVTLLPGESAACTSDWMSPATGLNSNTATVLASSSAGSVSATDPAHFEAW